nr:endonuclease domain-containing protein [Pasteurella testudinis]
MDTRYIVELDGASHHNKRQSDRDRDDFFLTSGIKTIRFDVSELKNLTQENIRSRIIQDGQ